MKRQNSTKYSRKTVKYSATERQTARADILEEYPIDDRDLEEIIHRDVKLKYKNLVVIFRKFCFTLDNLELFANHIKPWYDNWDFDDFIGENYVKPPKGWGWDSHSGTVYRLPKQNR